MVEPLFAGLLAASFAFIELRPAIGGNYVSLRATHWILARIGVDGVLGAAAYNAAAAVTIVTGVPGKLLAIVVAAFVASAVPRTNIVFGKGAQKFGFGERYQRWLQLLADQIEDISNTEQSNWLWDDVEPPLEAFKLEELQDRILTYLQGRKLAKKTLEARRDYIESIIADMNSDDRKKRVALMQEVLKLDGRRYVRKLVKSARREARRQKKAKPPLEPAK